MDESSEESIRAQIAALQAKLPGNAPASPKRKGPTERAILAPGTPPASAFNDILSFVDITLTILF